MNFIIDGYNLAFSIPAISGWITKGETEKAIRLTINYIYRYTNSLKSKVILVFDGIYESQNQQFHATGIDIRFSKKPQTADDIIRNLIRREKNARRWTVVSSDHEIRNTARDMGAIALSAKEFLSRIPSASSKDPASETEQKYNPKSVDLDYWLKTFGETDSGE